MGTTFLDLRALTKNVQNGIVEKTGEVKDI